MDEKDFFQSPDSSLISRPLPIHFFRMGFVFFTWVGFLNKNFQKKSVRDQWNIHQTFCFVKSRVHERKIKPKPIQSTIRGEDIREVSGDIRGVSVLNLLLVFFSSGKCRTSHSFGHNTDAVTILRLPWQVQREKCLNFWAIYNCFGLWSNQFEIEHLWGCKFVVKTLSQRSWVFIKKRLFSLNLRLKR